MAIGQKNSMERSDKMFKGICKVLGSDKGLKMMGCRGLLKQLCRAIDKKGFFCVKRPIWK